MAKDKSPTAPVNDDPQPERQPTGPTDPRLSVPDFSDWENPKWGLTASQLVDVLQKEFTPIETCVMLRDWLVEDQALTVDDMLLRLFRKHHSYDGTLRKAYRILAGDERVAMNAVKKIYDKLVAENAGIEPVMGVIRVQ